MKNKKISATIAILFTIFFWGISASSNKIALREVPPATLALMRFVIASLFLAIINLKVNSGVKINSVDRKRIVLCGLIGVSVYFIFENYGLRLISASNSTILLASIPLFTVAIEAIIYKKPIGYKKMIGVCLSLIGVILVIGNSISVNTNLQEITGSLLIIGAALSWAIYSILNKPLEGKYPTIVLTLKQGIYGAVFLTPFALFERGQWQSISLISWINILYLALFCSALCYFLYLYALKHLGASQTNVYINLMPFIGVIAAFVLLGERLYLLQLLGGIVILSGIFIVNNSRDKETIKATEIAAEVSNKSA
ncbi:DMT family transporter [Alkaliphilus peptidifermentans]|uniref:Permease of the drug/metabolite transporter (DMT) superfamily n=1 Tax=Alkaliphilus peptidifermentans DSM 18978 TaxID=1120976 RepID=A0A1G5J4J5_9FIRM|nr:EamA family transporter [Alkaliphilus peptidifermentans]SCY82881.1 Permease of the drug/metabolite transporter (DMT) superfamily [Alkaliphilus peptidifermentans DSM 18978]